MLRFDVVLLRFVYLYVLAKPASAVKITNTDYSGIQTGSPFNITWSDADAPITLVLRMGNSTDLNALKAMAIWVSLTAGFYVWIPMPILPSGPYRFELADSNVVPDWSPQFQLTSIAGITPSATSTPSPSPTSTSTQYFQVTTVTVTATPSPSSQPTTSSLSPTTTNPPTSQSQTISTALQRHKAAVIAGIVLALAFLLILTTFFSIHLCRTRKKNLQIPPLSETHELNRPPNAPNTARPKDIETGSGSGAAQMSGALDSPGKSTSSPGVSIRTRGGDTSTLSTWGTVDVSQPSTHRSIQTNPGLDQMPMVMFPTIMSMEPVEIGSSGFGKQMTRQEMDGASEIGTSGFGKNMSEGEKERAHELAAERQVAFVERKSKRKGVKVRLKRLKMFL